MFGTLVAAGLPLLTAVAAEVGGLAIGVNVLSHHTDVSQYATNLIALIGLGVAIDYSLFIVSRFREELAAGSNEADAIAATVAAGGAVVFSGVTVGIGLCGLLFFQGVFIASMGGAAAIAVLLAVFWALTFLPALLAILGHRVNWVRLPYFGRPQLSGRLISGAAAIMVGVFLSFGVLAHTIVIKEIGIGLTIAVAVDASVVRILLVPAVMRVLGRVAWWAPKPLERVYRRLALGTSKHLRSQPNRA